MKEEHGRFRNSRYRVFSPLISKASKALGGLFFIILFIIVVINVFGFIIIRA